MAVYVYAPPCVRCPRSRARHYRNLDGMLCVRCAMAAIARDEHVWRRDRLISPRAKTRNQQAYDARPTPIVRRPKGR